MGILSGKDENYVNEREGKKGGDDEREGEGGKGITTWMKT